MLLNCVRLSVTPWTVARQAPGKNMGGLPFPPVGDLPGPGIEPVHPVSPALACEFFTTELPGRPSYEIHGFENANAHRNQHGRCKWVKLDEFN